MMRKYLLDLGFELNKWHSNAYTLGSYMVFLDTNHSVSIYEDVVTHWVTLFDGYISKKSDLILVLKLLKILE